MKYKKKTIFGLACIRFGLMFDFFLLFGVFFISFCFSDKPIIYGIFIELYQSIFPL